jgi:hypothetical protein
MGTFLIIAIIVEWLSCGGFCSYLASQKNRDWFGWLFLGVLFGMFALVTLVGLEKLQSEE